jgi:hypothetical protein
MVMVFGPTTNGMAGVAVPEVAAVPFMVSVAPASVVVAVTLTEAVVTVEE